MAVAAEAKLSALPFGRFLYAPVGVESNGMTLTVLSAFARLDLDPWEKTSQLIALTRPAAVAALRDIVARLPISYDGDAGSDGSLTVAERLAGLLPSSQQSAASEGRSSGSAKRLWNNRITLFLLLAIAAWGIVKLVSSMHS